MENVASELFHSQPFRLALLASRRTTFFPLSPRAAELPAVMSLPEEIK